MPKSAYATAVDWIQSSLRPFLKDLRFRVRGRTFNRVTSDGLTQVLNIQMGPSDPPGTLPFPGRENLHGLFTINLGVYVPEVARHLRIDAKSWIQDYNCCIRARLGETSEGQKEVWWHARSDEATIVDIRAHLEASGWPFFDRFESRDKILSEWAHRSKNMGASYPPRIVMAIILAERGERSRARELLALQALENWNPNHPKYVRNLAAQLDLEALDA